jgi:hypothetical protein
MLIPSFNGHIYIIAYTSSSNESYTTRSPYTCAQRIDLGDHIASTPLVADVDRNGLLDIIIGTLNGQVRMLFTCFRVHI